MDSNTLKGHNKIEQNNLLALTPRCNILYTAESPFPQVVIPGCTVHKIHRRVVAPQWILCILNSWADPLSNILSYFSRKLKSSQYTSTGTRKRYLMQKTNTQKSRDNVHLKHGGRYHLIRIFLIPLHFVFACFPLFLFCFACFNYNSCHFSLMQNKQN